MTDYTDLEKGWLLVPGEPTESMVIAGFEAVAEFEDSDHPDAKFGGCRGAARAARVCYAAMLDAAPKHKEQPFGAQEDKT